jgi:glycosyltransferase involved in cell wall biosynthesis
VVFEPVNQISRARNAGARAAQGDWIVFVDADSTPSPELFAGVAEEIRGGLTLAGGSTVSYDFSSHGVAFLIGAWNLASRTLRWAAGSFLFCEAGAFREAGGFSEALYASEEVDLSRKLKRIAKRRGKRMVILSRHPLHTSNRKLKLYSPFEFLRFGAKMIVTGGRSLRRRADCQPWYDGRR